MLQDKTVLQALIRQGLMTKDQAKEILANRERVLQGVVLKNKNARDLKDHPPTIVDVIAAYGMNRADRPLERLDEDAVFQALAREHTVIPVWRELLAEHGHPVEKGQGGYLVIQRPFPSQLRTLWNDPATGVMRHADAGYDIAIECAREQGLDLPMLRG
mgnify:CR=1 FL=1